MDTPEEVPQEGRPAADTAASVSDLRVALFSDSISERNGTGAYYHDLAGQLEAEVGQLEMFQPLKDVGHPRLAMPLPGDPTQRLISPNFIRVGRGFRKLKPHIVVSVTPGPFGILGLILARRYKVPFISAFHTDFEALAKIYWNPVSRAFVNTYLRNVNRLISKRSSVVLVNNSDLIPQVEDLGAKKVEVMGTPVQTRFIDTPMKPPLPELRQFCFAGRLAAEKNIETIIEAAAAFKDIRFKIAGDGPLREKLQRQAAGIKNIDFLGWLTREELLDLIDASNLLLLPSHVETFGSIALEAMARGRPALVSANAGIHDWPELADGLFKLHDGESLADALAKIVELPQETWQKMALFARNAAEHLNIGTIRQWADILTRYSKEA